MRVPPSPPPPRQWFTAAGFTDIQLKRIGPSWYRGVRRHGLIMGCSVTARKPAAGPSPLELGPKAEVSARPNTNPLAFVLRVVLGSVGGAWGLRRRGWAVAGHAVPLLCTTSGPSGLLGHATWCCQPARASIHQSSSTVLSTSFPCRL